MKFETSKDFAATCADHLAESAGVRDSRLLQRDHQSVQAELTSQIMKDAGGPSVSAKGSSWVFVAGRSGQSRRSSVRRSCCMAVQKPGKSFSVFRSQSWSVARQRLCSQHSERDRQFLFLLAAYLLNQTFRNHGVHLL